MPVAIAVRSETDCPTAAEVGAALRGLVPAIGWSGPPDTVDLVGDGARLSVRLVDPGGKPIAERRLPDASSCADRARAAAVIVAAWEARLRAGAEPSLLISERTPAAPAPAAVAPVPAETMGPAPAPPPPPVRATSGPAAAGDAVVARTAASPLRPIEVEVGTAFLASATGGGVAPGLAAEVTFSRRDSSLVLGIAAVAVGTHSIEVASAEGATAGAPRGDWSRLGGVVDVRSRASAHAWALETRAGIALTILDVRGRSLPITSQTTIFDPGVLAGLRLGRRFGRVLPWIDATAVFWPRAHGLYVSQSPNSGEMPTFEALIGAGVSLLLGR